MIIQQVTYNQEKDAINNIRRIVFQEEQGVSPELEFDGQDHSAIQLLAYCNNQAVGTARIRQLDQNTTKIERLAVVAEFRGQGIGKQLMIAALEVISRNNYSQKVIINAQEYIQEFYKKLGFTPIGSTFMEAGIPHIKMIKQLN